LNRNDIESSKNPSKGKDSDAYSDDMDTGSILSMNTKQAVGVRTVDAKPQHSDGVRIQSIGKKISSRDMDYCVVRTGVGCGTEIQMVRSISGRLQSRQYFKERDRSISNERDVQSVGLHRHPRPKIYTKIRFHFKCRTV